VELWLADSRGHEAVGELPGDVNVHVIARTGDLPPAAATAEFLVPRSGDPRLVELLPDMACLRVVQTISAGVDWLLPILPPGVTVCDAAGARDIAVAEWVMAAILSSVRALPELRDRQREHEWAWRRSGELAGRTVMILGHGSIGAAVEARLAPFEVELIRVARRARPGVHGADQLMSLLGLADVVVVLLPLTAATSGLLEREALSRLRPGALLVNAARGPVLDTQALLEALEAGRIGAVLDVTDPEPLPADHPLWDAPGLMITPHLAGDTDAGARRAFEFAGDQVRRYLRGEQLENVVADGY
jgi:phosphoglycerate dehydrogenase-like enzyme